MLIKIPGRSLRGFCCCLAVVFCVQIIDKKAYLIDSERKLVDIYKSKKMA